MLEGKVIKFTTPNLAKSTLPKITDSDIGILTLLTTLANLSEYISSIELRIAEQQSKALQFLAKKQMTLVQSHLRSRKRLEGLLGERIASSDKLSEVLGGIERAQGDEEVDTHEPQDIFTKHALTLPMYGFLLRLSQLLP